ncbi:MAG: Bug family tripartite tricarboxylate transporter substrate binding protein [Burkholderiales bacterium]
MKLRSLPIFAISLFLLAAHTQAQDWPRRTITLIVPNAVGGAYDAAARPLGQTLAQVLGQPVVIDNRPAGGGIAGLVGTQQATPDGHTLLFTGQGQVSLYPELRANLPYEPTRDLSPIIRIGALESFVMVGASLPARNMKELIDIVRAKPDTVTFGTWGGISTSNMHIEYLKKARNIQFFGVPYKSAAQALNAGVSGEVQVTMFGQGPSIPLIKGGKFRALGTTGTKRSSVMPDVPLLKETGVGWDLETGSWVGMFAPAKTPRAVITRVNAEVGKLLSDRVYTDKFLLSIGFQPEEPNTPEQFTEFLKQDRQTYANLIKLTGIKDE